MSAGGSAESDERRRLDEDPRKLNLITIDHL
jgi:hypothetical protein